MSGSSDTQDTLVGQSDRWRQAGRDQLGVSQDPDEQADAIADAAVRVVLEHLLEEFARPVYDGLPRAAVGRMMTELPHLERGEQHD